MSAPGEEGYRAPEAHQAHYAENIFQSLPEMEVGVEIPRASVTRLISGKDAALKLSPQESVEGHGWNAEAVVSARKGDQLLNLSGQMYEVVGGDKKRLRIRAIEDGAEGVILYEPRTIKSHEYMYQLRDSAGNSRKIKVHDTVYKDRSLDTSEFLDHIMTSVPAQCLEVFDEVRILKRENSKGGKFKAEPALISNTRSITLYVDAEGYPTAETLETFYHELGHTIAKYLKGNVNPGERWKKAMAADGNSVSEYAAKTRYPKKGDQGEIEDLADTVMMYLATDGAKTDATKILREFCRNRFQKLDEVFEDLAGRRSKGIVGSIRRHLLGTSGSLDK